MERVESGVVLIFDGYNREGACDMLCEVCRRNVFVRDTTLQMVLSHARKNHVCGSVKCACLCEQVLCNVYTPRRLHGDRHRL